jgi:hypothetical protein
LFIEASTVRIGEIATRRRRPNFRQRRIGAFTAACCYAKSAPRALQCGDVAGIGAPNRLAAGRNPVSGPSENRPTDRLHAAYGWHGLEQDLPVA